MSSRTWRHRCKWLFKGFKRQGQRHRGKNIDGADQDMRRSPTSILGEVSESPRNLAGRHRCKGERWIDGVANWDDKRAPEALSKGGRSSCIYAFTLNRIMQSRATANTGRWCGKVKTDADSGSYIHFSPVVASRSLRTSVPTVLCLPFWTESSHRLVNSSQSSAQRLFSRLALCVYPFSFQPSSSHPTSNQLTSFSHWNLHLFKL